MFPYFLFSVFVSHFKLPCVVEIIAPWLHVKQFGDIHSDPCTQPLLCGELFYFCLPFMQVVELDLSTVDPCCSGPKRPQDKVAVSEMKQDFETCLGAKVHNVSFQYKPY